VNAVLIRRTGLDLTEISPAQAGALLDVLVVGDAPNWHAAAVLDERVRRAMGAWHPSRYHGSSGSPIRVHRDDRGLSRRA